jgi:maltose phosphorylase
VLNSCNWIGIDIEIDGEKIDLGKLKIVDFYRELNMQFGTLSRKTKCRTNSGKEFEISSIRFCSMANKNIAAISYSFTPLNFNGNVKFSCYLDGNVYNHDANYDEFFWKPYKQSIEQKSGFICSKTKKTNFLVAHAMKFSFEENHSILNISPNISEKSMYVENNFDYLVKQGQKYTINKYVSITNNLNQSDEHIITEALNQVELAYNSGFDELLHQHKNAWANIWNNADIQIDGDPAAQQGIRFNIFQLYQTYTGDNPKLNIGPKGFTGEKYGGATYWDTEAYCIPFYLKTTDARVARQLLIYRYNQFDKAVENAKKLGFKDGAALYPMVTMNGEECHNEWEITFEEIHRNGAIAFAIYSYIRHTGDHEYLKTYGRTVINGIARFWAQRFNWSSDKKAYVMLGVTGPNEYENNVNNNWYTNYIAKWCIEYALITEKTWANKDKPLLTQQEIDLWENIIKNVYLPKLENSKIFLQQDGFMDKELLNASDIPNEQRPINQHWSWDRILRSVFIKQADVLQGIYFFEEHFDLETIKENFNFYEPKTVHESSLSPCIHAVIAAKIGNLDKAYEMYLRTSRLDLDDYNHEADEGLHITSMAGTWISLVEGLAGIRVHEHAVVLNPVIPENWKSYSFKIQYMNNPILISVSQEGFTVENLGQQPFTIINGSSKHVLEAQSLLNQMHTIKS